MDDRAGSFVSIPDEAAEEIARLCKLIAKLQGMDASRRALSGPPRDIGLSIFHVGEILTVKTSFFRVKSIKPTELRLKLLPTEGPWWP